MWALTLFSGGGKTFRQLYFQSSRLRKFALKRILRAQGFHGQLDQYKLIRQFSQLSENNVFKGGHRATGERVAIKSIPIS